MDVGESSVLLPKLIEDLNRGEVVYSDVGATIPGVSAGTLPRFLLDLARAVAAGTLKPDKLPLAVRCTGVEYNVATHGEDLADALWYAWQEVEGDASGDAKTRVADAAKEALKEALVTKQQLFESGEGEFFEWCGLVVSKDVWRRKEIRSHTKHVYVQRKFNLLREESEGYAKLATLLNQQGAGRLSAEGAAATLAEMKALIGYFDLDPNRCVSVVLDAFTQQPDNDAFLALMPEFSADACAQVLGWHFFRCRGDSSVAPPRPAQPAPPGLYVVAAKMIRADYATLEGLMAHLSPSDEELQQAYKDADKKVKESVARIGIISLVSAEDVGAAPPGAPPGLGLRRDPSATLRGDNSSNGGAAAAASQPKQRTGLLAAALELSGPAYAAPLVAMAADNQKLLLLAAFLQIGDWGRAQELMRWLGALGLADFAAFPAVGRALCSLIGRELQPVYAAVASAAVGSPPAAPALPDRLLELLRVAGQHLYHDITVLTKLVRVLAAMVGANGGPRPIDQRLHERLLALLTQSALPAMSLLPGNAALVYEVWAAISQLPYTDRFCLYSDLKEGARSSPLLTASGKLAETEVRRILRRVTAPANKKEAKATMKPLGRMLAKIAHAAPLPVAEQLIRQVMGMPGMVTSIVESLKYLTPMAFDVMTYAVLKQLASPKKKLKDDGVNLEEWYQWLAAFTGLLCKKHGPEVEVVSLLQYVANQLKSSESLDLLVLKEMVQTMTGYQAVFEVSEHQLDALAGSDTLKAEVITQGEHRSSDKSLQRASSRLLAALRQGDSLEQRLAMPLLVLLAQQRKLIMLQSQSTHLKLIAELYDKCQEVCTQYAEFLQHALPCSEYTALLPSMEELATEYCIDPEIIFSLYRPLIRHIEPPAAPAPPEEEEEGEVAGASGKGGDASGGAVKPPGSGAAAANGPEPMEEEGEVVASPRGAAKAAVNLPAANGPSTEAPEVQQQRWEELERQVRAMHGGGGGAPPWRGMSPALYATFWVLQLYDLEVPAARYEATIAQLRTDIRIAQGDIDTAKRDAQRPAHYAGGFGFRGPPPPGEGAMGPGVDVEQLQKDIERAQAALDKLPGELKAQQANAAAVEGRLQREKGGWVAEGPQARALLPREFAQFCLLPRMLNSPADALYCARFIRKVHQLDVPGFNLLTTINYVMREFGFLVRVCTPREATNFGIFLNEVFALVERWRSAEVFKRECATANTFKVMSDRGGRARAAPAASSKGGAPPAKGEEGGAAGAADAGQQAGTDQAEQRAAEGEVKAAEEPAAAASPAAAARPPSGPRNVDHREWLNLCFNWQKRLTDEVFASCLQSRDYMQAKNALLALNRCVKVYPAVKHDASLLIDLLKPIRDKDPREDLKTLARMYCTALEMQMRDKARNMVATREEYAGLPPKKRPARPAPAKSAATSQGKPPVAAAQEGGKQGAAADGERAAAAPAEGAAKEDGKQRGSDKGKGPAVPPGMGVSRRSTREGGASEREAAPREHDGERERRAEGRGGQAREGPPPGFGSADKLKHAGSTTELRRGGDPAAAERDRREQERQQQQQPLPQPERRGIGSAERPPRPASRADEAAGAQHRDQRSSRAEERGRVGSALRPEAAPYVPREGSRLSGGSTRAAEEPAAGERDAKRPRREDLAGAADAGRERERGERRAEQAADADKAGRAERGDQQRPSSRDAPSAAAAAAAAPPPGRERGERERGPRDRIGSHETVSGVGKEAAVAAREPRSGASSERAQREVGARKHAAAAAPAETAREPQRGGEREARERPTSGGSRDAGRPPSGDEARRDAGHPTKRKREEGEQAQTVSAADRQARAVEGRPTRDHVSERPPREPREAAEREARPTAEGRLRGRREAEASAADDMADARAAARAALPERKASAAPAEAAPASLASASDGERERRHKRERKEKDRERDKERKKKDRKLQDKKHKRKDRSSERGGSSAAPSAAPSPVTSPPPVAAPAEERRREERRPIPAPQPPQATEPAAEERRSRRQHERPPIPLPPQPDQAAKPAAPERESRRREERQPIPAPQPQPLQQAATAAEERPKRRPIPVPPVVSAAAEAEERGSKRRRREEPAEEPADLPARLRGRLGSSLLGVALKDIAQEHEHEGPAGEAASLREREGARDDARRPHRSGSGSDTREQARSGPVRAQQQRVLEDHSERRVREVREVREVGDGREVRRGGGRPRR